MSQISKINKAENRCHQSDEAIIPEYIQASVPVRVKMWLHTIDIDSKRACWDNFPGLLELSEPENSWNVLTDKERRQIKEKLKEQGSDFLKNI